MAVGLRLRNIDVTTAAQAKLLGAGDIDHLAFAKRTGRVAVTRDADFLRLDATGAPHSGIVFCRQGASMIGEIIRGLTKIHDVFSSADMHNRVEFI